MEEERFLAEIMDLEAERLKELTAYLEMPHAHKSTDVLNWYHVFGDKFPSVTLMWRQFYARPAASAGPERLFSGASKMHHKEAGNMKSSTIERTLLCAKNCDPCAI